MAIKIYNAISGTGEGNAWTAGGDNVGLDQAAEGGTESSSTSTGILSVPFAQETDERIKSCPIVSVSVTVRVKSIGASGQGRIALRFGTGVGGAWYYGTTVNPISQAYTEYTKTWTTSPDTSVAWTWGELVSGGGSQMVSSIGWHDTVHNGSQIADHTYMTVTYADVGLNNCSLAFR